MIIAILNENGICLSQKMSNTDHKKFNNEHEICFTDKKNSEKLSRFRLEKYLNEISAFRNTDTLDLKPA